MKNPDWNGNPPENDEHAKELILAAAREVADSQGVKKVNIQNVAKKLKITRQTVYRHFPTANSIRTVLAVDKGGDVLDRVIKHTEGYDTFEESAIESIIFLSREIPKDEYLRTFFLGEAGKAVDLSATFERDAMEYSFQMLKAVHPGPEESIDDKWLFELTEHILRILMTLIMAPSKQTNSEKKVREYLRKWLLPVLHYPPAEE